MGPVTKGPDFCGFLDWRTGRTKEGPCHSLPASQTSPTVRRGRGPTTPSRGHRLTGPGVLCPMGPTELEGFRFDRDGWVEPRLGDSSGSRQGQTRTTPPLSLVFWRDSITRWSRRTNLNPDPLCPRPLVSFRFQTDLGHPSPPKTNWCPETGPQLSEGEVGPRVPTRSRTYPRNPRTSQDLRVSTHGLPSRPVGNPRHEVPVTRDGRLSNVRGTRLWSVRTFRTQ